MAEVFLRAYGGDRYEAYSAGFELREMNPRDAIDTWIQEWLREH